MLKDILEMTFLQNRVLDYLIFLLALLVGILIVRTIKSIILHRYSNYMDIQQKIDFASSEKFERHRIEFAYPAKTLFLSKT